MKRPARARTRRGRARASLVPLALAAILIAGLAAASAAAPPTRLDASSILSPPLDASGQVKVAVALHVLNLSSIDEVTERFHLTGYLVEQWRDPRLAYPAAGPNDKFRTLLPRAVWRPELVILNAVEQRHSYETSLRVAPDGLMSFVERFDAVVTSTFNLTPFPFDAQKLEVLVHPFTDQQQFITFVPSLLPVWTATEFNTYSSLESWRFQSLTSHLGRAASQFGAHAIAEARFEIAVARRYQFYLWKVFLPLLLMVVVSWSVFWFDPPEVSSQVTIAVTTILTIIAFALTISLTLPRVPYLTFVDAYFLTCYIFAFVAMLELTAVHVAYRNERRRVATRIRRTARWLVPVSFVAINAILIVHFLT